MYLTIAAITIAFLGLAVGVIAVVLLLRLTGRFDKYDAAVADLKQSHSANTRETGERISANQSLLRKRIDHLEDEIKRHSTRIDLFKKQVTADVTQGTNRLDERISALALDGLERTDDDQPAGREAEMV